MVLCHPCDSQMFGIFLDGGYEDKIWCDVIPLDITYSLLGRPWLFEWKVCNDKQMNVFFLGGKENGLHLFHYNRQ